MSLLLDALNKADQERKRGGENPNISSNHDAQVSYAKAKPDLLLKLLLGGVLLVLLLIAVYWMGKKNQQPTTAAPIAKTAAPAATPTRKNEVQIGDATVVIGDDREALAQASDNSNTVANEDENIASLYQHQARDTLPIQSTGAPTTETRSETIVDTPASTAITVTAAPATSPMSLSQFANLPDIQDLPNTVLHRIPSLKYSEHNYNANGGSVVINGIVRHANDQLIEGLVIDKILEDGMILHFENYSFKMRAMNTWVNM